MFEKSELKESKHCAMEHPLQSHFSCFPPSGEKREDELGRCMHSWIRDEIDTLYVHLTVIGGYTARVIPH